MEKLVNLINGEMAPPANGQYFVKYEPSTGVAACEVPDSNLIDVAHTVRAANTAWSQWQKVDLEARHQLLVVIARKLKESVAELAKLQSQDEGMPLRQALEESVPQAVQAFVSAAARLNSETEQSVQGAKAVFFKSRAPHGVVLILAPAFDSLAVLATRSAAAMASGNVVVAKASEYTPRVALAFAQLVVASCQELGLSSGAFQLLQGRGVDVGRALVAHPGLSVLSFTGRTETGKEVIRESAEFLKKTQLSLGAKNPVLVFGDGNWEAMVPMVAKACFRFHGNTSLRGSRLMIQESIYKKFLELFKAESEKLVIGSPLDKKTDLGPLVSEELKVNFKKALDQGLGEKGKPLFGGNDLSSLASDLRGGYFVEPAALFDLTNCSTLQQDEVIGPFVTITSFKYQHEAIKYANTSPFGQASYVYQALGSKALRTAAKLETGRVFINSQGPLLDHRMTYQALKGSGFGEEGVDAWMKFFSKETLISQDFTAG